MPCGKVMAVDCSYACVHPRSGKARLLCGISIIRCPGRGDGWCSNSLYCRDSSALCACRPRHWRQLMVLTGQELELDPKTCTLDSVFSMQLHRFAEDIRRVVSGATKELTIEVELRKLADAWQAQRFILHKYSAVRATRP